MAYYPQFGREYLFYDGGRNIVLSKIPKAERTGITAKPKKLVAANEAASERIRKAIGKVRDRYAIHYENQTRSEVAPG